MIIPWQSLNPETLDNIIESFILREGTDYGINELSLSQKKANLLAQIQTGEVILTWSELHQSLDIKPANHFTSD